MIFSRYLSLIAFIFVLVITCFIYIPGLYGGFLFDDIINITQNPKVLIDNLNWNQLRQAASSFGGGGLDRPISMLSFGVNHALTGLDPFYFKLTNLAIHLMCGVSLWLLTQFLLSAYRIHHQPKLTDNEIKWLSVAVSSVWLLHPFNLTSVLYIVQRMASLAALFMILGLMLYTWGRLRQLKGQHGSTLIIIGIIIFSALAALSKENGILLPILAFFVEWLIFGFKNPNTSSRYFVISFNVTTAIIPSVLVLGFLLLRFDWVLASYDTRDFTLSERLLTQTRVLWFYIQMIMLPDPTQMGLYHDDIVLSKGWLDPITTLPAALSIIMLPVGAIALWRRAPLLAFGIFFFLICHTMESTILPLEIAHEHRNYLPAYGLLLAVIYYLGHRRIREQLSFHMQTLFFAGLVLALSISTAVRAHYWANDMDLALVEAQHHPNSARTNMQAGKIFFNLAEHGVNSKHNFQRARQYFEAAQRLDSYNLSGSFALLVLDDREKQPVNLDFLDNLTSKLGKFPLSSASINALINLSRCQNDGPCKLPPEVFNHLFQAMLQNPTLRGKPRAQILTELAQFAISQGELGIALLVTQQALEIASDDPQIHLNQANLLIHIGEFQAANQAIKRARTLDNYGFLSTRIQAQEKLLEQAKARLTSNPESYEKNSTP